MKGPAEKKVTSPAGNKKKKPENKAHSMRTELSGIVIATIAIALIVIGLANAFLLTPFYRFNKQKKIEACYKKINELSDASALTNEILTISVQDNISITIVDSDFQSVVSTTSDAERNTMRLFGYYTGFYAESVHVIEKKKNAYTIQETTDSRIHTSYLEMWGQLSSGDYFLLQTPLESLSSATRLTNLFYIGAGTIVIAVAAVLISFVMKRYTKPIVQLTDLSKRMANLDFDARYKGKETNEIGDLGRSFNKMSDELEKSISSLKAANVELQKDNEKKTQIDELRKEFLNNVSHELKTPIALIQGYAEGLTDGIADDEDSRNFYCGVILDEAKKMNLMVRRLLTLNQLEFGNDPVVMDRFDIVQLISGVISGMQLMISDSGAEVSFPYSKPVYVWGDEFKIEEVVTNYMTNAIQHCEGEKRIEVTLDQDENHLVTVSVFNTGKPIPEEDLGRVFEKFYKVDKAHTRSKGGSGLGLSIVKAIIDGHGQKCGVKDYDNGVSFWFTIEGKV
jgi:two-component system sensor histidine kinase VanS